MIYFDYAATTPLDATVLKKMLPFFSKSFANPASVHAPGQAVLKAVDDARYRIAEILGVKGTEIIFCSGATEANNLALRGLAEAQKSLKHLHIISSPIEHASVLEPLQYLKSQGARISYLPVDSDGLINPETVINAIEPETILVSIAAANSETGIIQPIKKIGRLIKKYNERRHLEWLNSSPRLRGAAPQRIYFHSDATQAANFIDCRPEAWHLDMMSLSGHKFYGPKGVGLLFVKSGLVLSALARGGHQERNIRSGTLHVAGIIGMAAAFDIAVKKRSSRALKIGGLRERLVTEIRRFAPDAIVNTKLTASIPSHLNVSFPGWEGDRLLAALSERGIAVSTGSACASGDISVSPVLRAMGRSENIAASAIRFSLGTPTSAAEIAVLIRALRDLTHN